VKEIILSKNETTVIIPMPIQVVIDDVGWWSGQDGSEQQEPYRTGIGRNHVPADYEAIAELGRLLSIRPQAAMVLCEWDINNVLRKLPSSTWMGKDWNNSKNLGPWLDEAAHIIRNSSKYFEFTLHGIGHEYWTGNIFTRAEWAEVNGTMRPLEEVEKHLDFYSMIMDQHQMGSFPVSFVPTAFNHGFGPTPGHTISMAEVLRKRGVTYINTPFSKMFNAEAVDYTVFGFDAKVMTIDRGQDLLDWNITGEIPVGKLQGPTCGMHWANLIHPDPLRNSEIVNEWVKLLAPYNEKPDTMLASDSISFQNQLAFHKCTSVKHAGNTIELDFRKVDALPNNTGNSELTLKVTGSKAISFQSDTIVIHSQQLKRTEDLFLYTLRLKRSPGKDEAKINYI
jgi:hypothetical protein